MKLKARILASLLAAASSRRRLKRPVPRTMGRVVCRVCGWTTHMLCPHCPGGCGCNTSCSGWRHRYPLELEDD